MLECFFALIPDLAAIISSDNCFRRVNPAWQRTLGYSTEELLDAPIARFVHPDDLESTLKRLAEEFAGVAGTGFVNRYLCKSGSSKWIQWEAALAPDKSVVLATGRDITEQKGAEQKAEDRDRQLSTIFSSVSDALFLLSVEAPDQFRFVTVNRKFLQSTGLEESEVLGKCLHEVVPEASYPKVLEHYREAIRKRIDVRWHEESEYPAGTRYSEVNISPICDETGICANVVGRIRDLTDETQSLLEKVKLQDQLRQAQKLESVGRMAGGIAHDFNNLLIVITGYSELLQTALSQDDPLQEYALNIAKAGERAAELIKQLLAFSRKQAINLRPLDLNSVVSDTEEHAPESDWRGYLSDHQARRRPGPGYGGFRPDPSGADESRGECARRDAWRRRTHHRDGGSPDR